MEQGYEKRTTLSCRYEEEWNKDKYRRPGFIADM
jgi:hypothetical protein